MTMATELTENAGAGRGRGAMRGPVIWLYLLTALVAGMVLLGGATRLTDSGLSITEWAPLSGALPPLTEADWVDAFEKYKQIPEYALVNARMTLDEFKSIFWWEWAHRFYGRCLGLVFFAPFVWFLFRRSLSRAMIGRLAAIGALGGLQGLVGWWMVASGLSERIDVSQYRLAVHLGLALALFAALFWTAMDLDMRSEGPRAGAAMNSRRPGALGVWAPGLAVLAYGQMLLGAFVAGLRAGGAYPSWPLMNGDVFPSGYFSASPGIADLFETYAAVQFNHRLGAYVLIAAAVIAWLKSRDSDVESRARLALFAVLGQASLGIGTVLKAAPIGLALAHQAGGLIVLAACIRFAHGAVARACAAPTAHDTPRSARVSSAPAG